MDQLESKTWKLRCPEPGCNRPVEVHLGEFFKVEIDKRECDHELVSDFVTGFGPRLHSKAEREVEEHIADLESEIISNYQRHFTRVFEVDSKVSDADLGSVLREYISEADHQGWEGFTSQDRIGVARFLSDLALYFENRE